MVHAHFTMKVRIETISPEIDDIFWVHYFLHQLSRKIINQNVFMFSAAKDSVVGRNKQT